MYSSSCILQPHPPFVRFGGQVSPSISGSQGGSALPTALEFPLNILNQKHWLFEQAICVLKNPSGDFSAN